MPTAPRVIWSLHDWCDAISELPASEPLPQRIVLVPNSRVLHALRRHLIDSGRARVVVGTRFLSLAHAPGEVLAAAGESMPVHEDRLRPARLLSVFASEPELEYFDARSMRATPGWAEAFCTTLTDLEGADLSPDTLPTNDKRWRDVATIWRQLNALADGFSVNQAIARAADLISADAEAWPFAGATLAAISAHTNAVEARLVRAIPRAELAVIAGRPLHDDTRAHLETLFGAAVAEVTRAEPTRASSCERDILAAWLFEEPVRLLSKRPRSAGRDHTVELEDHAGVEDEIEAAVTWVCDRVVNGTALSDIALLVPSPDPLVSLLAQRLRRLPEPPAIFVAGGLPVTGLGVGARVLDVVRALGEWLSADALAPVVPHLQHCESMSPSAALETVWSVGTGGGSHAHREAALRWPERIAVRIADLEVEIAQKSVGEDDALQSGHARETRAAKDLVARLRAMQAGVQGLATLAGQVLAEAPLATLITSLLAWSEQHLVVPVEHQAVIAVIEETLRDLVRADPSRELTGTVALRVIADTIEHTRFRVGRFGEPAIYIGTVHGALGLAFAATRVLGLSEGTIPSAAREDPLLPDALRAAAGAQLPRAAQRSLAGLHAIDWAVRNCSAVCLSAPRSDTDRTTKEPSSLFVEAAAALGRGSDRSLVPSSNDLLRHYFAPARQHIAALRQRRPLSEAAWQERLARHGDLLPPTWVGDPSCDLERTRGLHDNEDGLLGATALLPVLPGLTRARAISPTRLGSLLGCPRRFVFESLLGWSEPAAPPLQREIAQPYYGSLLHLAHETFFDRYGAAFGARQRSIDHWLRMGANVADTAFDKFLHEYPLTGDAVREQQRKRLLADFARLLRYDWDRGEARAFHSTEQAFGFDEPLPLTVAGATLYVRGRIDRIDVRAGVAQIRDLKSGKPHPRIGSDSDANPGIDLQIALYTMVARARAADWGLPDAFEAAYVYPRTEIYQERAFTGDIDELLAAAEGWMALAHSLMAAGSFPQTPDPGGCDYCAFAPNCGAGAPARAAELLANASRAELAAFAELYGVEG